MSSLLLLLLGACHPVGDGAAAASPAPVDWFYADAGDAIDWSSIRFDGADVLFRTIPGGGGLRTGPVTGSRWLACGEATRATLLFEAGALVGVHTSPEVGCVEELAQALDWAGLRLDDRPLGEAVHALVVYDVPAEGMCTSCS